LSASAFIRFRTEVTNLIVVEFLSVVVEAYLLATISKLPVGSSISYWSSKSLCGEGYSEVSRWHSYRHWILFMPTRWRLRRS